MSIMAMRARHREMILTVPFWLSLAVLLLASLTLALPPPLEDELSDVDMSDLNASSSASAVIAMKAKLEESWRWRFNRDPIEMAGLLEGDIMETESSQPNPQHETPAADKNSVIEASRLWPEATVPYVFSAEFAFLPLERTLIRRAMKEISKGSCVKFTKRKSERDYLKIVYDKDKCYSFVGRNGGKQVLSLGFFCVKLWDQGTIYHELMHALGFYHEHSRPDRDDHVVIRWDNIEKGQRKNFEKRNWGTSEILKWPYDLDSIMHYNPTAFSRHIFHTPTIISRSRGTNFKRPKQPSQTDYQKLNALYKCSRSGRQSGLKNNGRPRPYKPGGVYGPIARTTETPLLFIRPRPVKLPRARGKQKQTRQRRPKQPKPTEFPFPTSAGIDFLGPGKWRPSAAFEGEFKELEEALKVNPSNPKNNNFQGIRRPVPLPRKPGKRPNRLQRGRGRGRFNRKNPRRPIIKQRPEIILTETPDEEYIEVTDDLEPFGMIGPGEFKSLEEFPFTEIEFEFPDYDEEWKSESYYDDYDTSDDSHESSIDLSESSKIKLKEGYTRQTGSHRQNSNHLNVDEISITITSKAPVDDIISTTPQVNPTTEIPLGEVLPPVIQLRKDTPNDANSHSDESKQHFSSLESFDDFQHDWSRHEESSDYVANDSNEPDNGGDFSLPEVREIFSDESLKAIQGPTRPQRPQRRPARQRSGERTVIIRPPSHTLRLRRLRGPPHPVSIG